MKVAIVGGTGAFGRALAKRLTRSAQTKSSSAHETRRERKTSATELGVAGGRNDEIVDGADIVVLAVKSNATLETARELAAAIGATPVLCVASDLRFTDAGVLPAAIRARSRRRSRGSCPGRSRPASSRSPLRTSSRAIPATRSSAAVMTARKSSLSSCAGRVADRAIDAGPLENSRALEGMTAVILNVNRRYKAHAGIRLTGLP